MCSNTINNFSTSTTTNMGQKRLILIIAFISLCVIIQGRPVSADEVPWTETNTTDFNNRLDSINNQRQREEEAEGSDYTDNVPVILDDQEQEHPPPYPNLFGFNQGRELQEQRRSNQQPSDRDIGTNPNVTESGLSNSSGISEEVKEFLSRNLPLLITTIVGLTLILLFVVHSHAETTKAIPPLKKKVVDLNRNFWKVNSAFENGQDDLEAASKLSHDKQVKIESLEAELHRMKEVNAENQKLIKRLKRGSLHVSKDNAEAEDRLVKATKEMDAELQRVNEVNADKEEVIRKQKRALLHFSKVRTELEDRLHKTTQEKNELRVVLIGYVKLAEEVEPILLKLEQNKSAELANKGIKLSVYEPLRLSVADSRKLASFSHEQTYPIVMNKSNTKKSISPNESSVPSDPDQLPPESPEILGDPTTTSPKKKRFWKRPFAKISRCFRKDKSELKKFNNKRSSRSEMMERVEERPP